VSDDEQHKRTDMYIALGFVAVALVVVLLLAF
jgi:hypothetical protein